MKRKASIGKQKTSPGKRRMRKQSATPRKKSLAEDDPLREMRSFFEENRSLDALALFAKFYERF